MTIESLDIWVNKKKVGQLIQENYIYSFQYQDIASLDLSKDLVSLTMPIRAKQYETQILMPPFQMVLPEGALLDNLRTRFGKVMDISNDIILLRLIGNHTLGRVRFTVTGQPLDTDTGSDYSLEDLLSHANTEDLFKDLMEQLAPRSGISGVQPKVLWTDYGKKVSLPLDRYILKSSGPDYPGLAVNEYFCLKAARTCGLKTPDFHLAKNGTLLVVERFDIDKDNNQLAFEEFCALLHLPNHGKYNSSYESVAEIIQKTPCEPLKDARRDLFKSVLLSMLLRNGDAHLKNFGILYNDTNKIWLAPMYDLVSTVVYMRKDVPALSLAGKKQWPDLKTLCDFGIHHCGLRVKEVKLCIKEVDAGIAEIKPQIRKFGSENKAYYDLCESMLSAILSSTDLKT